MRPFDYSTRASQVEFSCYTIALGATIAVLWIAGIYSGGDAASFFAIAGTAYGILCWLSCQSRRCHDLGLPAWFPLPFAFTAGLATGVLCAVFFGHLGIIVGGFVFFAAWGVFSPGDKGTNEYGPPPEDGQLE